MALTPAQKRANAKYQKTHKDKANFYNYKSKAKNFIKKFATEKDIKELKQLLHDRELQLLNSSDKD